MANPDDITTGDLSSETWADAVAMQVVRIYASTGARDADLTSPFAGQVVYISSNDSSEGVWVYSSAGQWRRPWNLPWGLVASASNTTTVTLVNSSKDIVDVTFTPLAGRDYRVEGRLYVGVPSILSSWGTHLYEAGTFVEEVERFRSEATGIDTRNPSTVVSPTAGAKTYQWRIVTLTGGATRDALNADVTAKIEVYDIGASGAPS